MCLWEHSKKRHIFGPQFLQNTELILKCISMPLPGILEWVYFRLFITPDYCCLCTCLYGKHVFAMCCLSTTCSLPLWLYTYFTYMTPLDPQSINCLMLWEFSLPRLSAPVSQVPLPIKVPNSLCLCSGYCPVPCATGVLFQNSTLMPVSEPFPLYFLLVILKFQASH